MGEFYKMEFDAWDEGTIDLTLEEEAAYLRLCHQMYRRRGPTPNSERLLCSLWRCHPNKARRLLKKLIEMGKIYATPEGHLTNTRVTREVDTRETLRTQRADAGQTGGIRSGESRRKPLKDNDTDEAFASSKTNKRRGEENREESTGGQTEALAFPALVRSDFDDALSAWNRVAQRCDLVEAKKLTDTRRRKLAARLKSDGLSGWEKALGIIERSPFLRGQNDRGWRADFDFVLNENNFTKILEGKYSRSHGEGQSDMYLGGDFVNRDTSKMHTIPGELTERQIRAGVK